MPRRRPRIRALQHRPRFSPPPPPPPEGRASTGPPLGRWRLRSAAVELTVALVVLLIVALIAGPGGAPHRPSTLPRSAAKESAAVTLLMADLTALQRDAAGAVPSGSWAAQVRADNGRLATDLAAAQSLPSGPTASLSTEWSAALAQLGAVVQAASRVVQGAGGPPPRLQADIQSLDIASGEAVDSLLRLAARLER